MSWQKAFHASLVNVANYDDNNNNQSKGSVVNYFYILNTSLNNKNTKSLCKQGDNQTMYLMQCSV